MQGVQVDNKRVAKNTMLLYFRMLFLLAIGLFTSRVIIQTLGIEDYGINSVIAGFLSMFGIFTSSISSAISRFITVELGKGNIERLKRVFSTSIVVQVCMGIVIIVLIETLGLWFLNNKMNIPSGREYAAQWCLHSATLITFVSLMNIPFNSTIVAHEKMSAFAYMTILDALLKLAICYLLYLSPFDKLITYAILGVIVSLITTSVYWIYCYRKFPECTIRIEFDKPLFKEIWGFAGWFTFGQASWILNNQGVNMLMNIFFGVVVNAARGVAVQVNGILNHFVKNFMMALNPQITKSYAAGDKENAFKLACRGSRFSFYILYVLALPIMIESSQILKLWLGTPPKQADAFLVWTILSTFTTLLGNTLVTLQIAHGNIRHYQIWITTLACIPFPVTWIIFKCGAPAISAYYVYVIVYWLLIFVRYYLVHGMTGIPARMYLIGVVLRCHLIGVFSAIVPILLRIILPESIMRLLIVCAFSVVLSFFFIYKGGLEKNEKTYFKRLISNKINSLYKGY